MSFTSLCTLGLSFSKELREEHLLLVFKSNRAYLLRDGLLSKADEGREREKSRSNRQPCGEGIRLAFARYSRRLTCPAWKFHSRGAQRRKKIYKVAEERRNGDSVRRRTKLNNVNGSDDFATSTMDIVTPPRYFRKRSFFFSKGLVLTGILFPRAYLSIALANRLVGLSRLLSSVRALHRSDSWTPNARSGLKTQVCWIP